MKKCLNKLKCLLGLHTRGYPNGLHNLFGSGYRIEYYTCSCCRKNIHWSVKVDY